MENKFVAAIITTSIVVILAGSFLMPIINDAVDDVPSKTVSNASVGVNNRPFQFVNTETTVIFDDSGLNINGSPIENYGSLYAIASDKCFVYFSASSVPGIYYTDNGEFARILSITNFNLSVTQESITGSITNADGTTQINLPVKWAGYYSTSGDYRIIDCNSAFVASFLDPNQIKTLEYAQNADNSNYIFISTVGNRFYANGVEIGDATFEYQTDDYGIKTMTLQRGGSSDLSIFYDTKVSYPHVAIIPESVEGYLEGSDRSYVAILYILPAMVILSALVATISTLRRY